MLRNLFSLCGGLLIGLGIAKSIFDMGLWAAVTIPIWGVLFIVVLCAPYAIEEWWHFRHHQQKVEVKDD